VTRRCVPATAPSRNSKPLPHSNDVAPLASERCCRFWTIAVNPPGNRSCEFCIRQSASMSSRRKRSLINGAASLLGPTSSWSVLDEFTNTTETDIVSVRLTAATWLEIADLSRSTANEWVSPQPSYFTKAPKSSPARTAYWEEAGIRDALRGGRRR
jgi:hypothetical protein